MAAALRLLLLVALMLVPLSIAAPPAMAHPLQHADPPGACALPSERDTAPGPAAAKCAVACTLLATPPATLSEPLPNPRVARRIAPAQPFAGVIPEIATPPPKTG